jgi:predicted dehydrogenase
LLTSARGAVASLHVSWTQWKPIFSIEVHGTEGYAIAEGLGGAYGTEKAILGKRDFNAPFNETIVEFRGSDQSWKADLENFFLEFDLSPEIPETAASGLAIMALIEAIYTSHQEKKTVKIDRQSFQIK